MSKTSKCEKKKTAQGISKYLLYELCACILLQLSMHNIARSRITTQCKVSLSSFIDICDHKMFWNFSYDTNIEQPKIDLIFHLFAQ